MSEWMSDREPNTEEEKPRFNRSYSGQRLFREKRCIKRRNIL